MIVIKRISNEDEINHYEFENSINVHNELINFLDSLGFEDDELNKIDTPFFELNEEYLFAKKEDMKIHFFVCENRTHMIIDSRETQDNLSKLMKNYFIFPHWDEGE